MVAIKDALGELTTAAEQLNTASDQLNETIAALDADLAKTGVGISVWLNVVLQPQTIVDGDGDDWRESYNLGYAKTAGEWCMVVRREQYREWNNAGGFRQDDNRVVSGAIPLQQAPRSVRLEAAPHLEELIRQLAAQAKKFAANVEEAQKLVE